MRKEYQVPQLVELGIATEIVLGPFDTPPQDNALGYAGYENEPLADAE